MMAQDSSHPTGVADDSERGNKEVARARDRKANAALQMKLAGASWADIAEVVGYPTERLALIATEKALEKELQTENSQSMMRGLAGKRLERLLRGVWPKAINPEHPEHLAALSKAQSIITDHAKLFGLNAPTEMVFHSPSANELEKWVQTVVQTGTPALEEADIFDAEVVDDAAQAE